jgi:hypothetical protein
VRRGPDRLNAAVLTVLALVLLGVGAYGLARGYGAFGDARAGDPMLTDEARSYVSRNSDWFWPLAAVLSLLVAWLGLRWLIAQLSTTAVGHLPVRADGPGHTELLGAGATSALARDIEEYPGVHRASARLIGDHPVPEISVTVDVGDDADIATVRRRIEEHALVRFRSALELTKLRSQIHLRLAPPAGRSVR